MNAIISLPANIPPVSTERLALAFQRGTSEAAGKGSMAPLPTLPRSGMWIEKADDDWQFFRLTDDPLNRFIWAILDLEPFDAERRFALAWRAWVLLEALEDRRFQAFRRAVEGRPDQMEVSEALVAACARMPMSRHDWPKPQDILREARRIAAEAEAGQGALDLGGPRHGQA